MDVIERSAFGAIADLEHPLKRFFWFLRAKGDPNDWRIVRRDAFGIRYVAAHDRIMRAAAAGSGCSTSRASFPDRLHIELDALASRVLFDAANRAIGVEFLKGRNSIAPMPDRQRIRASGAKRAPRVK